MVTAPRFNNDGDSSESSLFSKSSGSGSGSEVAEPKIKPMGKYVVSPFYRAKEFSDSTSEAAGAGSSATSGAGRRRYSPSSSSSVSSASASS